jgi:hypothetical protein
VTEVATPESAPAPAPVASEMPAPTTEVAPAPAPATEVAPASAPAPEPAPAAEVAAPATTPVATNPVLTAVRLLLKETRTGAFAGKLERVAEELGKSPEDFLATLVGAGLKVPDKSREKPVFVEHAGEIFWLNRNAKEELWLNAKASKFAEKDGDEGEAGDDEKKSANRRGSRAKKKDE